MIFDRPTSDVGPCPSEDGLDLIRERIAWLDERSVSPAAAR